MKPAGAPCPVCKAFPCAEFALMGQPPRWTCNGCGARGEMSAPSKAVAPVAAPKKHWRDGSKA